MSAPESFMPAFLDHLDHDGQQPPDPSTHQTPRLRQPSPGDDDDPFFEHIPDYLYYLHHDPPPLVATNFFDVTFDSAGRPIIDGMPPNTRSHAQASSRPARLPNGYVDLTSTPDSPPQTRKRESSSPGPSAKRQRRDTGPSRQPKVVPATVEEVDLTDEKVPVQGILQKQRQDAVQAQVPHEEKASTFSTFTCVICMDAPTDLTATACGHLFCHTCLMEALIAGENRAAPGEQKRSQCPVCRKFLNRRKESDIIPLSLKKGLATQPKKKVSTPAVLPKVQ